MLAMYSFENTGSIVFVTKMFLPSIARHLCYIIIRAEQSARTTLVKTWINVPFISFSSFQTKYWNFRRPWFFLSKRSLRALRLPLSKKQLRKEQLMEIDAFQTRMTLFLLGESLPAYGRKFFIVRKSSRKAKHRKNTRSVENFIWIIFDCSKGIFKIPPVYLYEKREEFFSFVRFSNVS